MGRVEGVCGCEEGDGKVDGGGVDWMAGGRGVSILFTVKII